MSAAGQIPLFGHEEPRLDDGFRSVERLELGRGAWVELARGWLAGHASLFEALMRGAEWRASERIMYERRVEVPRLHATLSLDAHPALGAMRRALDARYATAFDRLSAALYRDGRDSVAWHGDCVARELREAIVATVSLGSPRRFLLRPTGGGRSMGWDLGFGDLLVMGGSCQRTHQHAVPKVARAGPRIAIMFRPTWET